MKKYSIFGLIALAILIGSTAAMGLTIDDTGSNAYWGGVVYNNGLPTGGPSTMDVIGTGFALDGINVFVNGSTMTVDVIGPYFAQGGLASTDSIGDLYISSKGWVVPATGSPNYPSDTFKTDGSEKWDYVVGARLDSIPPSGPAQYTTAVFNLDFGAVGNSAFYPTTTSLSSLSGGRALQAWKGGYGGVVKSATITLDKADSMLIYQFDDSFLPDVNNVGFHWTMNCGNDIVEGQGIPTVPEPGSLLLLGFGLVGLVVCRKRTASRV